MDKLQLTGQNLGRVFNFRNSRVLAVHLLCYGVKLPNLKLTTPTKQFLGSLLLDITLPGLGHQCFVSSTWQNISRLPQRQLF
jgi:hypothetical protein